MIRVRPADRADIPWLFEQLRQFAHAYGTRHSLMPDDGAEAVDFLAELVAKHPVFVAETERWNDGFGPVGSDTTPVGFIAGAIGSHPFKSSLRMLTEMFWWVAPEYRGTSAGARLFAAFDAYGQQHADWIVMTLEHHSAINPDTLIKRGYHVHEVSYLKEII